MLDVEKASVLAYAAVAMWHRSSRCPSRKVRSRPIGKFSWLPTGHLVRERDRIARVRTEIGIGFEVREHLSDFGSAREKVCEHFLRDLLEREFVPLPIERDEDFVEAHEIADQRQMLAVSRQLRVRERAGDDVAEFTNIAHVNDARCGIDRQCPAQRAIRLFLRRRRTGEVLVVKRRDNEGVIRKAGLPHDLLGLGFVREVRNVELAAADCLDIRQCRPDEVLDAGLLGRAYRRRRLLEFVGAGLPCVGDDEDTARTGESGLERFGVSQIRRDDFVGEVAMLARIASQRAYFELTLGL